MTAGAEMLGDSAGGACEELLEGYAGEGWGVGVVRWERLSREE